MNFLAADQTVDQIFGKITPPPGMDIGGAGSDPNAGFGQLVAFGLKTFIVIAGLFMLAYLLWGALDWIVSGGDKEKLTKAQNKITNAVIGVVIIFVILTVFNVLAGNILGIIRPGTNGWDFIMPSIQSVTPTP